MIKKIIALVVSSLLTPLVLSAAPNSISVTGTYSNGTELTVSGADFGTKTTAAPVLWDTVENQSSYSALGNGDAIPGGVGYPWGAVNNIRMNTTECRNGGECYKSNGNQVQATLENLSIGTSPAQVYVSWWWKPSASPMTNNESHSSKFIRTSKEATLTTQTFSWTQNQNYVFDNPNYVANNWNSYPGTTDQWNFHEVWFDNTNKTYTIKVNGQALRSNASWSSGTFNFDYVWMVGWDSGGSTTLPITTWMDDVYVDKSFARVMLCAGSSWASSGKCELQPASVWGGTSISITGNTGAFPTESTAYLYIVDTAGAANSLGVPVTIGESGGDDTTAPVRSLLAPSGTLTAGTTSTTISLVTDEAATCRYSATAGTAYADMTLSFGSSYALSHSATVSGLTNGSSYSYYVRCIDGAGNANTTDSTISFSVASGSTSAGSLSWQYSTYSAVRADGRIPINIVRTGGSTGSVTVQWSSNGQTATHDVDYYGNDNVTVTFADGVTTMPVNAYGTPPDGIEMIANGADDDRYFQMILSNPTGGATLGTTLATVTIEGDYAAPIRHIMTSGSGRLKTASGSPIGVAQ